MSDPRQEDRERLAEMQARGPVEAQQDGWCEGCYFRIRPGELIVERHGSWLHEEGTCVDEFESRLRGGAA